MADKFYITNRTNELIVAEISDTNTGNNVLVRQLIPGNNELDVTGLGCGVYFIHLVDNNHHVYYEQQIVKE
jgi:hypothetical protein